MVSKSKSLNPTKNLVEAVRSARKLIDEKALAHALITGKCELLVRDLLAAQIDMTDARNEKIYSAREWRKHDLSIFQENELEVVVEGKAWIHADMLAEKKLNSGKKSVWASMKKDLLKLQKTKREFGSINTYLSTLLVTCDASNRDFVSVNPVKYDQKHQAAIRRYGNSDEVRGAGNRAFMSLVDSKLPSSTCHEIEFLDLNYRSIQVKADFFLIEL